MDPTRELPNPLSCTWYLAAWIPPPSLPLHISCILFVYFLSNLSNCYKSRECPSKPIYMICIKQKYTLTFYSPLPFSQNQTLATLPAMSFPLNALFTAIFNCYTSHQLFLRSDINCLLQLSQLVFYCQQDVHQGKLVLYWRDRTTISMF